MSYSWRHKPQQRPIISRLGWCIGGAVLYLLSSMLPYANDNVSQSILQRAARGEQPSAPFCLTATAPSDRLRWSDYLRLKHRTWAWFDQLDVDPVELLKQGVIAPFPKLTSLDVGTHKGSSPTVWHNERNQRVVAMQACHHFSAYGPASSPLAWDPGLYSQTIFLARI